MILLSIVVFAGCGTTPIRLGGSLGVFGITQENMAGCSWKIHVPPSKVQCKHNTDVLDTALRLVCVLIIFLFCLYSVHMIAVVCIRVPFVKSNKPVVVYLMITSTNTHGLCSEDWHHRG